MTDDHPAVKPLSGILEDLLREDESVTVGEITDRVARRGFGLFMIVLALPTLIPVLPPGSAATIGLL
ncbi:MAG: exopolysaccharide biosynthesis protein, partial [Armatimonadetes bacterium]|nr:exopolysaccharide biosynthesis protein [Armatimonadota bacterium]